MRTPVPIWPLVAAVLCLTLGAIHAQDPERPIFSAHSDLVVLRIGVVDEDRGPVTDLGEKDFIVYEDGHPQTISIFSNEDVPVTVGLVIDSSSSMASKRSEVYAAAMAFARSSNPRDELFVVTFNENVRNGLLPDTPFTADPVVLREALLRSRADGKTALYDAIDYALDYAERGHHDQKVLVVLSDGADNTSSMRLEELEKRAAATDTVIYTVGLFSKGDPDGNPGVLKKLAMATGGTVSIPGDIGAIVSVLEGIAREIRTTYTIGYVPGRPDTDGKFRKLRVSVRANGRDLRVRHREGYTPGKAES